MFQLTMVQIANSNPMRIWEETGNGRERKPGSRAKPVQWDVAEDSKLAYAIARELSTGSKRLTDIMKAIAGSEKRPLLRQLNMMIDFRFVDSNSTGRGTNYSLTARGWQRYNKGK